jgi:hypothetical protein
MLLHAYELKHSVTELREEYKIEKHETFKIEEKEKTIMINIKESDKVAAGPNHNVEEGKTHCHFNIYSTALRGCCF